MLVVIKYFKFRAAGVGLVDLLQDHNGILHVVVRKLNPEVSPAGAPPWHLSTYHLSSIIGVSKETQ